MVPHLQNLVQEKIERKTSERFKIFILRLAAQLAVIARGWRMFIEAVEALLANKVGHVRVAIPERGLAY